MFFFLILCFSITLWPYYALMASLCSIPSPSQNLCPPAYPDPFWIAVSTVEALSLKHRRQAPRQQLCLTHVHQKLFSLLHFTPPHPSFHSSSSNPPFPFSFGPHHSIRNRWSPQRTSFKPFTYSPCCSLLQFSQPPLKPRCEWQPETSVPRAGSTNRRGRLKEMSKLGERRWKEAKGQLLRKTFQILFIKQVWQHFTAYKYKNHIALMISH